MWRVPESKGRQGRRRSRAGTLQSLSCAWLFFSLFVGSWLLPAQGAGPPSPRRNNAADPSAAAASIDRPGARSRPVADGARPPQPFTRQVPQQALFPLPPLPALAMALADDAALTDVTAAKDEALGAELAPTPATGLLAGPVVEADAVLACRKAQAWSEGSSRFLLLDSQVRFAAGSYGFKARRAVVKIDFEDLPDRRVHHLSLYLEDAEPLAERGAVRADAGRLLVTCSTSGKVELETDMLDKISAAPADPLVDEAAGRFQRHHAALDRTLAGVPEGPPLPGPPARALDLSPAQTTAVITPDGPPAKPMPAAATQGGGPAAPSTTQAASAAPGEVIPRGGTVLFNAERVIRPGPAEGRDSVLVLMGNVVVAYQVHGRPRSMALRAERAVLFVNEDAAGKLTEGSADADVVQGVYLEDNVVATDGQYTVRGPRVYYDPARDRALVLDAVFYTWDVHRKIPIYVRAQQVRQEAATAWSAHRALVTTSEFAEPHFAIAAEKVTFAERTRKDGTRTYRFTSYDNTAQVGGVPVFYWPWLAGEPQKFPLRRMSAGYKGKTGPEVETTWDVFALAGRQAPEGVDLTAKADYRGEHGPAGGVDLEYDRPEMKGFFESYLIASDDGEDEIANRRDVEHDSDTRGYLLWRHRHDLQDNWQLTIETAYVSDETFLEEFFHTRAENDKPWETSIHLKKQEDDWALTFLGRYDLYDFVAQTPSLQSSGTTLPAAGTPFQVPGYAVEKLPELGYFVVGRTLFENRLTYYGETRAGRMRIVPGEDAPEDRGFNFMQSLTNFGFATVPPTPLTGGFDNFISGLGIPDDYVFRFDSRHELQAPLEVGPVDVVPFVAGRVTAYDDDFKEFSGESESVRLWGQVGVRLHSEFSRTYDVQNPAVDMNQLRHIVEPQVELSLAAANLNPEDLPVYDLDVESIREGSTARFGVRQTLQTQRGGPGRWRTVDWLTMSSDVILTSSDTDAGIRLARFISYRPEFSTGGDHFHNRVMWMVSDALSTITEVNYDLERSELAEWRTGVTLRHTPRLSSYVDYADLDAIDSSFLSYGFNYQLTRKYRASFVHRIDIEEGDTRRIELQLERKLPRWRLVVVASHDDIDDEQSVGFMLVPEGLGSTRRHDALSPIR
jgi:hypothetical protein